MVCMQAIPDTIDIVTQIEWYGIFGEIGNVKFLICRRHPVNAATQYEPCYSDEPRGFSEEADSIWQSEDIVEFMNMVTPRYIGERGENEKITQLFIQS